ncbi:MAG: type II secretion system F family protein [Candidatus Nanoarchaeia archaeon]
MFYRLISKLFPRRVFESYKKLLDFAHIRIDPYKFTGFILSFGFGFAWVLAFGLGYMFQWNLWLTFIITFVAFEVTVYVWLLLSVDAKAKFIEKVLPDALQLMSSNMRAGFTPERALLLSARPEFGPLTEEIMRVGKEITVGKNIDDCLLGMASRINSDKFKKTMMLIVSGLRAGGELASLLDQTARNLRNQEFINQKVRANIRMYVIFIFAAICIGAPLLYGLSSFLVEVMTSILSEVEIPKESLAMNLPITITKVSVTPGFVITYIITSISITSILGGLMMGLILHGEEKYGFKLIPFVLCISIGLFFLVRFVVSNVLGGLFTF